MLEIKNIYKTFNPGTINEKVALNGLSLKLNEGDFVTSLKNFPFQNEALISKFAADGILSVEQAKNYHSIKSLFQGLITTYALLSDETNDALRNDYFEEKKRPLTIKIQEQLNALSS